MEPLSVAASIVGITAPALHGTRLLLDDLRRIVDAPDTVESLKRDLDSIESALELVKAVTDSQWESLGENVLEGSKTAMNTCRRSCERFRSGLHRWTRHSEGGRLSWRDRATVGFFKQSQIESMSEQLQNCRITLSSAVSIATLSMRHTSVTEEMKTTLSKTRAEITENITRTDEQLREVKMRLERLPLADKDPNETASLDVEVGDTLGQIKEEQAALDASRKSMRTLENNQSCRTYSAGTDDKTDRNRETPADASSAPELGPMARRLEEATEEALLTGGRAGRRTVEEAGFSEELKERLFARVKDAQFRSENAAAFAEAGMPTSAGQGTRLTAASQPWTGTETTQDAVLRMLNDAHKPLKPELRGRPKMPDLQPVDMRMGQEPRLSAGKKAASARDKASAYSGMGLKELEKGLSEDEKEAVKKEFRDRFRPAARAMPSTLTGLASLANERIEDAIARGQFKNIPRGRDVERDSRADNPFIDTTEYIMNKMIKRQDIVPPWIEKQQELVRQAHVFRTRLRNDWKRYAARMIASKGGSLEEQMNRARRYAKAEELHNPRKRNVDQIAVPTNSTDDPVMAKMRQQGTPASTGAPSPMVDQGEIISEDEPLPPPFRDPAWLAAEKSYMDLSISNLNALTRSYNLMAPELAKKPYFSLERELDSCFADVAPQLADVIKERAAKPSPKSVLETLDSRQGSVFDRFGGQKAKVYESKAPHYGFREMWRDLFSRQPS
ncbi:hypothetical protein DL764_000333 [Monosporascus ibericus]|uniref:DnaJ homologue subfamily C member 28 conserved domain-containing protein n=1 Tax=Monosporascus ibericus TaxID=155417 RepID=A0A4Q4TX89_9PEZI|nr:hypothetical protein DL764_000333 [Monosporascus ibericus]